MEKKLKEAVPPRQRPLALVTGAGIRVGRAIALALAQHGYDLLLHANSSMAQLEEVAGAAREEGARVTCLRADLSSQEEVARIAAEVRALVEGEGRKGAEVSAEASRAGTSGSSEGEVSAEATRAGTSGRCEGEVSAGTSSARGRVRGAGGSAEAPRGLDLLVHNAAIFEDIPFGEISWEAYRRMQAINLEAPFFLSQALLPCLARARDPQILHIGDIGGERPVPGYAHYSVSKAGLLMLTRALAVELAPKIRVNAVSPGTVAFPPDFDAEARREILNTIPLAREGAPEDIARAVIYLAEAPYVTGQVLDVDGGRGVGL